ncbi:helix-turn-helix domain-containing protein [Phyllobacterium endophyticum]|uniref:helix-turn-helix domain-containing protein n=1 Tax=Phyllobacterium endophyticum TaxID=1149773 RepID=UPI00164FE4E5|nr:helix-turn-helix domain-containing protein [Phyllobacterium endophyticum]
MTHAQFASLLNARRLSPQCRTLLKHLQARGERGVSALEAMMMHRIAALPRRISDLEVAGIEINRIRKTDETGRAYVRYTLAA